MGSVIEGKVFLKRRDVLKTDVILERRHVLLEEMC